MNICIVYLKNDLPEYAKANLKYLKLTFPNIKLWFLSDSQNNLDFATQLGYLTWKCSDPLETWAILRKSTLDHKYRSGFYSYALGRFHSLSEFMTNFPGDEVLHIETDMWLAPNFPFDSFELMKNDFAFTFEGEGAVIPGTLFIKNLNAMRDLKHFFEEQILKGYPPIDMFLLAKYFEQNRDRVYVLPTGFKNRNQYRETTSETIVSLITQNCNDFQGFFDSSTWGQYFFGIDPRNTLGIKVQYHIQKSHSLNPMVLDDVSIAFGRIVLTAFNEKKYLYSLHMHAKDVRNFDSNYGTYFNNQILNGLIKKRKFEINLQKILENFDIRNLLNFMSVMINKAIKQLKS